LQGQEHTHFELLKQRIVAVMQKSYPGINPSISEWKGQEITDLQEDLRIKVNANISEKWFYTHMKSSRATLPRIDMLNLLSRYAGYANWDDFVYRNKPQVPSDASEVSKTPANANRYFIYIPLLAVVIVGLFFGLFKLFNTREYRFVFIDADTRKPIISTQTEVILLPEGESPVQFLVEKDGSCRIKTDKSRIRMVVNAPYYQTDTITRIVRKLDRSETVLLKPDDYSMMIHYFSMKKVEDWEKRRVCLDSMINEGAMVYQVFNGREFTGMALYNKQEFIDKLTMPSGSLKNIEILSTQFKDGKIMVLRFRINEKRR
jgi:hypothetical protein